MTEPLPTDLPESLMPAVDVAKASGGFEYPKRNIGPESIVRVDDLSKETAHALRDLVSAKGADEATRNEWGLALAGALEMVTGTAEQQGQALDAIKGLREKMKPFVPQEETKQA